MKVACILTNGFEELEAIGTISILRRFNVKIDIYALHENEAVGRYSLYLGKLFNLKNFDENNYDMLFIAGGPQYQELENNEIFKNIILEFHEHNKYISAICAAPTILGHLGLLKGKKYTCFNSMNEDFGGTFIDKYAVQDGKLITGKSVAATIDFAFLILETVYGKEFAEKAKNSVYYYNN